MNYFHSPSKSVRAENQKEGPRPQFNNNVGRGRISTLEKQEQQQLLQDAFDFPIIGGMKATLLKPLTPRTHSTIPHHSAARVISKTGAHYSRRSRKLLEQLSKKRVARRNPSLFKLESGTGSPSIFKTKSKSIQKTKSSAIRRKSNGDIVDSTAAAVSGDTKSNKKPKSRTSKVPVKTPGAVVPTPAQDHMSKLVKSTTPKMTPTTQNQNNHQLRRPSAMKAGNGTGTGTGAGAPVISQGPATTLTVTSSSKSKSFTFPRNAPQKPQPSSGNSAKEPPSFLNSVSGPKKFSLSLSVSSPLKKLRNTIKYNLTSNGRLDLRNPIENGKKDVVSKSRSPGPGSRTGTGTGTGTATGTGGAPRSRKSSTNKDDTGSKRKLTTVLPPGIVTTPRRVPIHPPKQNATSLAASIKSFFKTPTKGTGPTGTPAARPQSPSPSNKQNVGNIITRKPSKDKVAHQKSFIPMVPSPQNETVSYEMKGGVDSEANYLTATTTNTKKGMNKIVKQINEKPQKLQEYNCVAGAGSANTCKTKQAQSVLQANANGSKNDSRFAFAVYQLTQPKRQQQPNKSFFKSEQGPGQQQQQQQPQIRRAVTPTPTAPKLSASKATRHIPQKSPSPSPPPVPKAHSNIIKPKIPTQSPVRPSQEIKPKFNTDSKIISNNNNPFKKPADSKTSGAQNQNSKSTIKFTKRRWRFGFNKFNIQRKKTDAAATTAATKSEQMRKLEQLLKQQNPNPSPIKTKPKQLPQQHSQQKKKSVEFKTNPNNQKIVEVPVGVPGEMKGGTPGTGTGTTVDPMKHWHGVSSRSRTLERFINHEWDTSPLTTNNRTLGGGGAKNQMSCFMSKRGRLRISKKQSPRSAVMQTSEQCLKDEETQSSFTFISYENDVTEIETDVQDAATAKKSTLKTGSKDWPRTFSKNMDPKFWPFSTFSNEVPKQIQPQQRSQIKMDPAEKTKSITIKSKISDNDNKSHPPTFAYDATQNRNTDRDKKSTSKVTFSSKSENPNHGDRDKKHVHENIDDTPKKTNSNPNQNNEIKINDLIRKSTKTTFKSKLNINSFSRSKMLRSSAIMSSLKRHSSYSLKGNNKTKSGLKQIVRGKSLKTVVKSVKNKYRAISSPQPTALAGPMKQVNNQQAKDASMTSKFDLRPSKSKLMSQKGKDINAHSPLPFPVPVLVPVPALESDAKKIDIKQSTHINKPTTKNGDTATSIKEEFDKILNRKLPIIWVFGYTQTKIAKNIEQVLETIETRHFFYILNLDSEISRWRTTPKVKKIMQMPEPEQPGFVLDNFTQNKSNPSQQKPSPAAASAPPDAQEVEIDDAEEDKEPKDFHGSVIFHVGEILKKAQQNPLQEQDQEKHEPHSDRSKSKPPLLKQEIRGPTKTPTSTTQKINLSTGDMCELIKLAMVSAQVLWNPSGFIIKNFPVSIEEGDYFQIFFYPISVGIYFLNSQWSQDRSKPRSGAGAGRTTEPDILRPRYFVRRKEYSEVEVEKAADRFGAKTIKVFNVDDLKEKNINDIVVLVKNHLQGCGASLRRSRFRRERDKEQSRKQLL